MPLLPFRDEPAMVSYEEAESGLWEAFTPPLGELAGSLREVALETRFGEGRWGIPHGDEVAEEIPLSFAAAAEGGSPELADAFARPFCRLHFVRHQGKDDYAAVREALQARAEQDEPCLVVLVGKSSSSSGGLLAKTSSLFKGAEDSSLKKTLSKLRDEFPNSAWCRLDAPQPSAVQLDECRSKMGECVATNFGSRVDRLHAELEQLDAEAEGGAGAEFQARFVAKEGVAIAYQQAGLPALALAIYAELQSEFEALEPARRPRLFGSADEVPAGTSAAAGVIMATEALADAGAACLEDLLDGNARNYREDMAAGELGGLELQQYLWWRRWRLTLLGGGDLRDALQLASDAIAAVERTLRSAREEPPPPGGVAQVSVGYCEQWKVCATLAVGASLGEHLSDGLGATAYAQVQGTLPLALGLLGALYAAASPLAAALASEDTAPDAASSEAEEESFDLDADLDVSVGGSGGASAAERVAEACESPSAAERLGRQLLAKAIECMRRGGRRRSALQLARQLAERESAAGRHSAAARLLAEVGGGAGCEALAGWPLLRADMCKMLADCHRRAEAPASDLAAALLPLLAMDGDASAPREELLALAAAEGAAVAEISVDRATAFTLTRSPLSPAQTVSETGSGTVIRHGCLQIVCAKAVPPASAAMPPPMTPEAAAEAAALGASAGRRLSLGTPPVAGLTPPPPTPTPEQAPPAGAEELRVSVVNISSRLRRLFLLPHGATAGELRAAIDRTGSFAADTTYDLCVGTDPPLGSEAPLSSLADRLVLLAPSGAGAEASAPPAVQPPTFLDDHGDSGHQGHV